MKSSGCFLLRGDLIFLSYKLGKKKLLENFDALLGAIALRQNQPPPRDNMLGLAWLNLLNLGFAKSSSSSRFF